MVSCNGGIWIPATTSVMVYNHNLCNCVLTTHPWEKKETSWIKLCPKTKLVQNLIELVHLIPWVKYYFGPQILPKIGFSSLNFKKLIFRL